VLKQLFLGDKGIVRPKLKQELAEVETYLEGRHRDNMSDETPKKFHKVVNKHTSTYRNRSWSTFRTISYRKRSRSKSLAHIPRPMDLKNTSF